MSTTYRTNASIGHRQHIAQTARRSLLPLAGVIVLALAGLALPQLSGTAAAASSPFIWSAPTRVDHTPPFSVPTGRCV